MDEHTPQLQAVPDLPATTEKLVAELAEVATERMASAYVAGFKFGIQETLRILSESGQLTTELNMKISLLLARWADDDQEDHDEHTT